MLPRRLQALTHLLQARRAKLVNVVPGNLIDPFSRVGLTFAIALCTKTLTAR